MEKRLIGDELAVSVVGIGCNNFGTRLDAAASAAVVNSALGLGITHFDTAEMYGGGRSEELLGEALKGRRDDAVIATKALPRPAESEYRAGDLARRVREGCEGSLRRLQTDYIDLYYQHYPDPDAPLEEALEAFDALVAAGKARLVACSNYGGAQLRDADRIAKSKQWARFRANQVEWNLLNRDVEAAEVPAAAELGVSTVPYFPLASGLLTGKYKHREPFPSGTRLATAPMFANVATEENFVYVERLAEFAEARGHTLLDLAIAWLAAQDTVASVIAGAMSSQQVQMNAAAAEWTLTTEDLRALPVRG